MAAAPAAAAPSASSGTGSATVACTVRQTRIRAKPPRCLVHCSLDSQADSTLVHCWAAARPHRESPSVTRQCPLLSVAKPKSPSLKPTTPPLPSRAAAEHNTNTHTHTRQHRALQQPTGRHADSECCACNCLTPAPPAPALQLQLPTDDPGGLLPCQLLPYASMPAAALRAFLPTCVDVVWLEVEVHNAALVHVVQRCSHLRTAHRHTWQHSSPQ